MDLYIFLKIQVIGHKKESGSPAWQRILKLINYKGKRQNLSFWTHSSMAGSFSTLLTSHCV